MDISAYYDIETENWDSFVCGVYLDAKTGTVFEDSWETEDRFWARVIRTKGTVLAHNGGRFDHLAFLDALGRFGILDSLSVEIVLSGASISSARVTGPGINVTLADSYKMFPMALKRLSNNAKDEVGLQCKGEGQCSLLVDYQTRYGEPVIGCGGYCRISRKMPARDLRTVLDYCRQDVLALRAGVEDMMTVADRLGITVRKTVGGTTWHTAKKWAGLGKQPLSERDYYYARSGYYGGRTSLFRRYAKSGFEYDITSSYPFQCSQGLPTGEPKRAHSGLEARASYRKALPGVYTARVKVPLMHIPPLPIRARMDGDRRLAYPTGAFEGTWALPELEYAESLGCKVEPIAALVFEREEPILADYMRKLIAERLKFGKDTREGEWLKLIANSLYGKLASRPETSTTYINPPPGVLFAACPICKDGPCEHLVRISKDLPVYVKRTPKIPDCGYIVWAAYITARGRIQLHKQLTALGGDDALYCDTDSVFTTRRRERTIVSNRDSGGDTHGSERALLANGIGTWESKGAFTDFQGIAPKVYRYVRDNGKPKVKAKGVVMPGDIDNAWDSICRGERIHGTSGVSGFKSAIRKGRVFVARHCARLVTAGFGDRIALLDGNSRPPAIGELEVIGP